MVTFEESNMSFSFEDADAFHIEEQELYKKIIGAKTCECIVLFNEKVMLIEAKSSFPQPQKNGDDNSDFKNFAESIACKFSDSLVYYTATYLKRHLPDTLPVNLQAIPLSKHDYEFCLIIFGHKKDWLPPVLDQMKKSMKKMLKLWGIKDSSVKVINEHMALSKGMITGYL